MRRVSAIVLCQISQLAALSFLLSGCGTISEPTTHNGLLDTPQIRQRVTTEQPGLGFVGRRLYVNGFSFWGYIKRPGESWSDARLVMLNEQQQHAPDRAAGTLGKDNGAEYQLSGSFSGDWVYEAASGRFFPEFVLTGYKLIDSQPPTILPDGFVARRNMFTDWPQGAREP
jgi:hypothetical protein